MKPYLNLYQINLPKFTTNSKNLNKKKISNNFVKIGNIWIKIDFIKMSEIFWGKCQFLSFLKNTACLFFEMIPDTSSICVFGPHGL